MNKQECAIVQDLLILYEEGALSKDSIQYVEEHLKTCWDCQKLYQDMHTDMAEIEDGLYFLQHQEGNIDVQRNQAKEIMREVRQEYKKSIAARVFLVLFAIFIIYMIADSIVATFTGENISDNILAISTDQLQVEELYQLENGELYCSIQSNENIRDTEFNNMSESTDGSREQLVKLRGFYTEKFAKKDNGKYRETHIIIPLTQQNSMFDKERSDIYMCKRFVIQGRGQDDRLVIWKTGERVTLAPGNVEKEAVQIYYENGYFKKGEKQGTAVGMTTTQLETLREKYIQQEESDEFGMISTQ